MHACLRSSSKHATGAFLCAGIQSVCLCPVQTYLHNGLTYVSQLLHNVRVTGLPYGQTIYYK